MAFSPTKVPKFISPELKRVCFKVSGSEKVDFVKVEASFKYKSNKCAYNARDEADSVGGRVVFGWGVFVWKNVMFVSVN